MPTSGVPSNVMGVCYRCNNLTSALACYTLWSSTTCKIANRANRELKLTWLSVQACRLSKKYKRHGVTRRSNSGLAKKCLNCPGAVSLMVLETLSFAIAKSNRAGLATARCTPSVKDYKLVLCRHKSWVSGTCKHRLATPLVTWISYTERCEITSFPVRQEHFDTQLHLQERLCRFALQGSSHGTRLH